MFNTAFLSTRPDLNTRQIDTFHDVFRRLAQKPEVLAWRTHASIRDTSLTWKLQDREETRFSRAGQGVNYLIAVADVVEADRIGHLEQWVEDAVYAYAKRLSEAVGIEPPRVSRSA